MRRATSYAMGHLVSNIITHGMEGELGGGLDSAVLVAGLEGTLGLFATILIAVGVALFGLSLMNVHLIGADNAVAILLAILPAVGVVVMVLIGSHAHETILSAYLIGNLLALVQVVWTTLLGIALIRRSDRLPAPAS